MPTTFLQRRPGKGRQASTVLLPADGQRCKGQQERIHVRILGVIGGAKLVPGSVRPLSPPRTHTQQSGPEVLCYLAGFEEQRCVQTGPSDSGGWWFVRRYGRIHTARICDIYRGFLFCPERQRAPAVRSRH